MLLLQQQQQEAEVLVSENAAAQRGGVWRAVGVPGGTCVLRITLC
jgi:hypothetical protein